MATRIVHLAELRSSHLSSFSRLKWMHCDKQHFLALKRATSTIQYMCNCRGNSSSASDQPHHTNAYTSEQIRTSFIDFFKQRGHEYVKSSSIIPPKNSGTVFTNAGMNQFKPIFLGLADPDSVQGSYRRVVNSQKCIRVGGKHNDLQDVGADCTHHTFFEMLGNWSFGDYFKRESIEMAWELLTEVYGLPADRLYVTYFAGDEKLSLQPDLETRDLWLQLGIPSKRILPGMSRDNFWDMGATGPCGPCTEIHYDFLGDRDASRFVNTGDTDVVELWNLVFMQYDRLNETELEQLPSRHVDTGMGLERLCSILQGKRSNYDTDLFSSIFKVVSENARCPAYGQGTTVAQNVAYRIVADHTRMFCVAIADGVMPGLAGLDGLCWRVRQIMHRCFRHQRRFLSTPMMLTAKLVDPVIDSLSEAYPELEANRNKIKDTVMEEEAMYLDQLSEAYTVMKSFLAKSRHLTEFTEKDVQELKQSSEGAEFASPDLLFDVAADFGVSLPNSLLLPSPQTAAPSMQTPLNMVQLKGLTPRLAAQLMRSGMAPTDDSAKYKRTVNDNRSYMWADENGKVLALIVDNLLVSSAAEGKECIVILDKTSMYAEAGGQMSDIGSLTSDKGVFGSVISVKAFSKYVLHNCTLDKGTLTVGDIVTTNIDQARRSAATRGHTATHLLNYVVKSMFGPVAVQRGSAVVQDRLTFSFSCDKNLGHSELEDIAKRVNTHIMNSTDVEVRTMPESSTKGIEGIIRLPDEQYPKDVRVVSIGDLDNALTTRRVKFPAELCGGTHVDNTSDIGMFTVTGLSGTGVKRMTALTGTLASESQRNMDNLNQMAESLITDVLGKLHKSTWQERLKQIYKHLGDRENLPKAEREALVQRIESLRIQEKVRAMIKENSNETLEQMLKEKLDTGLMVTQASFKSAKDVAKILRKLSPTTPVCVYNHGEGGKMTLVCYSSVEDEAHQWIDILASKLDTIPLLVKGKNMNNFFMIKAECDSQMIEEMVLECLGDQVTKKNTRVS